MKKKIAIFASGNGTNCENIIQYFKNHGGAENAAYQCFHLHNKKLLSDSAKPVRCFI